MDAKKRIRNDPVEQLFPACYFPLADRCELVRDSNSSHRRLWIYGAWQREAGEGSSRFYRRLHAIDVPLSFLAGWATIAVEIIGGAMILAGALVPLATIPMLFVLL